MRITDIELRYKFNSTITVLSCDMARYSEEKHKKVSKRDSSEFSSIIKALSSEYRKRKINVSLH